MPMPEFITFTGADDNTSIEAMIDLSAKYPIEWGILVSANPEGARFPSHAFIDRLREHSVSLRLSLHVCGKLAREISNTGHSDIVASLAPGFRRIQINGFNLIAEKVLYFAEQIRLGPILQCRGPFPDDLSISWLFDTSGGHGVTPESWPEHHQPRLVGYAGGIGRDNAAEICAKLPASEPFWIDMETKLRNSDDRFEIAECQAICEQVYGEKTI